MLRSNRYWRLNRKAAVVDIRGMEVATVWMKLFLWIVLKLEAVSKSRALQLKYPLGCDYEFIPLALKSYRTGSMENTQLMLNNQEIVVMVINKR